MKHQSKFKKEEESEQNRGQEVQANSALRDFGSVEELLRYDRDGVEVPERLDERVREIAGADSGRVWWKRILRMRE